MRLTFIGADHEVTGSCHFLEACGLNILIDCGMEQGINKYENAELPIPYSDVDYVLVTHAHIDHVGLLPLIYARGFRGQIMATRATCDLCDIMLKDCAHIQESEAEWKNRKAMRAGKPEACRSLSRARVINRMILDILGEILATIQTLLQLSVSDITAHDDRSVQ